MFSKHLKSNKIRSRDDKTEQPLSIYKSHKIVVDIVLYLSLKETANAL